VLERRKLERGNPIVCWGEKSPGTNGMDLSWETLWEADKPTEGPAASSEAVLVGRVGEKDLRLLRKGERGMTVKPISWVPAPPKTSKGVKASEDDQIH
jgi:hypothetical protein